MSASVCLAVRVCVCVRERERVGSVAQIYSVVHETRHNYKNSNNNNYIHNERNHTSLCTVYLGVIKSRNPIGSIS